MFVRLLTIVATAFSLATSPIAAPAGSAFSYQGRLLEGGAAAQGHYDLAFQLFPMETGGVAVSAVVTNHGLAVSNGVFSTLLDFGTNVFSGASCWLEISVRPAGQMVAFTTLVPRQLLTPAPYAIYTLRAESLAGPLPDTQLSTNIARLNGDQTFSGQVLFSGSVAIGSSNSPSALDVHGAIRAAAFSGNGTGLSNVTASTLSVSLVQRLWRVPVTFVAVTNANNEPDFNGKGAVHYNFRIGKYEINNHQYCTFLNAVAADDPHALYLPSMTTDEHGGIIRSGNPGEYIYTVKPGKEHHPIVWQEFPAALRFCNWLHNGQPSGGQDASTTEDGAYTMAPEGELANTIMRNPGARFWIPSDDEWYKAAYHQPAEQGGPPNGYWEFPTRSSFVPVSELPPGGDNSVNVCCDNERRLTPVGAYANTRSYYGAYDQAGNVQEWTEEIVFVTNRRLRGGSFVYNEYYSQSDDFEFDTPDYEAPGIGFRVAGALDP